MTTGARLGPYEIVATIGAGGMGEVLRARDTKLGREVAIKVLPAAFTQDAERVARFRREAQILASLNHPNIGAIHGFEESEGTLALVMELVEGEDLAERLKRGAIPVDEAIAIAKQIAEALEEAHEKGIVHRDLKPANVKVTSDGKVKVLDFGLAKAMAADPMAQSGSHDLSQSPTLAGTGTMAGMILGTAAYMSPEQARGKAVDKRADIWAFGVVLFEMLTGRQLFAGETVSDVLARVLTRDPDWSALPGAVPPSTRRLLKRCLARDPKQRVRDVGDVRLEFGAAGVSSADEPAAAGRAPRGRRRLLVATIVAALLGAIAGASAVARLSRGPSERAVARFQISLPAGLTSSDGGTQWVAIAPDDSAVALIATDGATRRVYVKKLGQTDLTPLAGTENAKDVFFSPDGRWVGFSANGQLQRASITDGTLLPIVPAADSTGVSWAPDGTLVFTTGYSGGLFRMAVTGGEPLPVTTRDRAAGEAGHCWPHVLPDGEHVLYTIEHTGKPFDEASIAVVSLRTGEHKVVLQGGTSPSWSPSGHLVYARKSRLLAVPFDLRRLEVTGEAITVLDGVSAEVGRGRTSYAISRAGSLAYLPGPYQDYARELAWVTRDGRLTLASSERRPYGDLAVAPDGERALVQVMGSDDDLWLVDLTRDLATRVTFGHENESVVWAADGKRFAWSSDRDGTFNLYQGSLDAGARIERLTSSANRQFIGSWSPDGILFTEEDPTTLGDIWALQPGAGAPPRPIVRTPFDERTPVLSPDGRWLAYASNETGRSAIFVQAFPGPGPRRQVSDRRGADTSTPYRGTGRAPRWSPDGRELFYFNGSQLMSVPIQPGPSLEAGPPGVLMELADVIDLSVAPDRRRFLVTKWLPPRPLTQLVVALGGALEIGRMAP